MRLSDAEAFLFSGASRETSREIMEAIVYFSATEADAVTLWENGLGYVGPTPEVFWGFVTDSGTRPSTDFMWGTLGRAWWDGCDGCGEHGSPLIAQEFDGRHLCALCNRLENEGECQGG